MSLCQGSVKPSSSSRLLCQQNVVTHSNEKLSSPFFSPLTFYQSWQAAFTQQKRRPLFCYTCRPTGSPQSRRKKKQQQQSLFEGCDVTLINLSIFQRVACCGIVVCGGGTMLVWLCSESTSTAPLASSLPAFASSLEWLLSGIF